MQLWSKQPGGARHQRLSVRKQQEPTPTYVEVGPRCYRGRYHSIGAVSAEIRTQPRNFSDLSPLARGGGLEPPTPRFKVWCSSHLNYPRSGSPYTTGLETRCPRNFMANQQPSVATGQDAASLHQLMGSLIKKRRKRMRKKKHRKLLKRTRVQRRNKK